MHVRYNGDQKMVANPPCLKLQSCELSFGSRESQAGPLDEQPLLLVVDLPTQSHEDDINSNKVRMADPTLIFTSALMIQKK